MRVAGWLIIIMLGGLIRSAPGWSQDKELAVAISQFKKLRSQGLLEEAVPFAETALAIGKGMFGAKDPNSAVLLDNLAGLYKAQNRIAEAEGYYALALTIREEALGLNHPDVAASLNRLAVLYHGQGKYFSAEFYFKRALKAYEDALGRKHPGIVQGLERYAAF